MPMLPAHRSLRDATALAHERLDALFDGFDLADRDDYRAFLQAHAEALLPLEAWLDRAGADAITPDWSSRHRADALREDLVDLGATVAPGEPVTGLADDAASVAGVLYVVEGSRLGGRMLARSLPAGVPHRYLDPGGRGPSWPGLLASIDAALGDEAALGRATQAAGAVFARFEQAGAAQLKGAGA